MSDYNKFRQVRYTPAILGLNGVTLAAERTSNPISLKGCNQLSVFVRVLTWAQVTRIDLNLDVSPLEVNETPVYHATCSNSIAAGVATATELDVQRAVSAATFAGGGIYEIRFGDLNAFSGRLRVSAGAGPGVAGDTVEVYAIAAYGDL